MPKQTTTNITMSDIATFEKELDEVPTQHTTAVSKRRAIALLGPELYEMRAKGYAWSEIAAWLTERGLAVSPAALQRYLRDGGAEARGTGRPRSSSRTTMRATSRPHVPPSATTQGAAPSGSTASGSEGVGAKPSTTSPAPRTQVAAPVRDMFTPRPDTKDL
jgi:hypothetical protein